MVDIVDMPYRLRQHRLHPTRSWSLGSLPLGAVDVVMMEQDDNVNYKELSALLIDALKLGFTAGGVPEALPSSTSAVVSSKALPDSGMTNNDDYLDTFYTLEQDQSYHQYPGAAGNAVIDLEPREIQPTRPDCRQNKKPPRRLIGFSISEPRIRPDLSAPHPVCVTDGGRSALSGSGGGMGGGGGGGGGRGNPSPLPDQHTHLVDGNAGPTMLRVIYLFSSLRNAGASSAGFSHW